MINADERAAALRWLFALAAGTMPRPDAGPLDQPAVLLVGRQDFDNVVNACDELMRLTRKEAELRKKRQRAGAQGGAKTSKRKTAANRANARKPRKRADSD